MKWEFDMKKIFCFIMIIVLITLCACTNSEEISKNSYVKVGESEYYSSGDSAGSKEYEYYENGLKAITREYRSDGGLMHTYRYVYEYDSEDNVTKQEIYLDGDFEYITYFEYNGKNKIKEIRYDDENSLMHEKNYEYDDNGNIVLQYGENSYGELIEIVYEYSNGNCISEICYNDGDEVYRYERDFNSDGKEIQFLEYKKGKYFGSEENEYDENGNLVRKYVTYDNYDYHKIGWYEYFYDDFGNCVEIKYYEEDGDLNHIYKYDYEKLKNAILE